MLGSSPVVDLLGMAAGHTYYFLEDVYPQLSEKRDPTTGAVLTPGRRLLKTPNAIKALFPQRDATVPDPGTTHLRTRAWMRTRSPHILACVMDNFILQVL